MSDKSQTTATPEQVAALVDAMDSILDDMGPATQSVCLHTKAKARIAFEPFIDPDSIEYVMSLDEAKQIVRNATMQNEATRGPNLSSEPLREGPNLSQTTRGWQKRLYLEAYRAANPNRDDPIVNYEAGWWVFRVRRGGNVERRVRTKEFAEMTFRLEARVKDLANAD